MASETGGLQVIIFTIIIFIYCNLCLVRSSSSSSWRRSLQDDHHYQIADYRKWVSWNLDNYRKKTTLPLLHPQYYSSSINGGGKSHIDIKLMRAEMNKMTVTVSQDGSADYTTISDALNNIPLHNTRRVILLIKPGLYRYICCITTTTIRPY